MLPQILCVLDCRFAKTTRMPCATKRGIPRLFPVSPRLGGDIVCAAPRAHQPEVAPFDQLVQLIARLLLGEARHPPIILHADEQRAALAVGQAGDRLDQVRVRQRRLFLAHCHPRPQLAQRPLKGCLSVLGQVFHRSSPRPGDGPSA